MRGSPPSRLPLTFKSPLPKVYYPHKTIIFTLQPYENFNFSYSHYSCKIFVLTLYSLYRQFMLILTLIDVHYLQNVALTLSKTQMIKITPPSPSDFYHLIKNPQQAKFTIPPNGSRITLPLNAIWKTLLHPLKDHPPTN